jgi:hypothetical protein
LSYYFPVYDPSNESSQKKVHQYRTEAEAEAEVSEEQAVPSPVYFHFHFYLNAFVVVV